MITTIKEFLESFEAPKNFKINMVPSSQMNRIINPYGNRVGEDDRPGVEVFGRTPQNIPVFPGFTRLLYKENNPKNKLGIDFGPIDIVYEKNISEYKIFSKTFKKLLQGTTMYYGWNNDNDYLDSHFFIIVNTTNPQISFSTDPVTLTKEEMTDTITKLMKEFDRFSLKSIEYINPAAINDGVLDDSVDYFH